MIVLKQLTLVQQKQKNLFSEKVQMKYNVFAIAQSKQNELFIKKLKKMRNDLLIKHQIEIDNYKDDFEKANPKHPDLSAELLARNGIINEYIKTKQ